MTMFQIAWRNLKSRYLSTGLSIMLLSLGVALVSLLIIVNKQLDGQFKKNIEGVDMVVGAKGSPLQLILSSVYHVDNPTGNINYAEAKTLLRNPLVESGIPLSYGDSHQGYRIVGTTQDFFTHYNLQLASGAFPENTFEVTVGAKVAGILDIKIGDEFSSAHGLDKDAHLHEDSKFVVVGLLKPSNTVSDNLILTNLESVWKVHHDDGSEVGEITAMLVKFRSRMGMIAVPRKVNSETNMQAALPSIEINRLFVLFGVGFDTLKIVAWIIIIISAISVFVSLFSSLKERKYELAIMRSLGATKGKVFISVITEGLILSIIGFVVGIVLSRVGVLLLSSAISETFHYTLNEIGMVKEEYFLSILTIVIGFIAGLLPALSVYKLDISKILSNG